jgi:diaminopimelate decarboxylase
MRAFPLHRLLADLDQYELPCFVYDPATLVANIESVRAQFPNYHYPVKCNPHPELVRAAIAAGAELDLCSSGDLEIANTLSALSSATSFTGVALTDGLMCKLAAAGCRVNLNSLDEAGAWAEHNGAGDPGLRVEVSTPNITYGSKFGVRATDLADVQRLPGGVRIAGLHVHDSHRDRSPHAAARVLGAVFADVPSSIIEHLEYVSVGGGWPHAYEGETSWDVGDVAAAFAREIEQPLRSRGFRGQLFVEPGEFVAASSGVWLARVASVKRRDASLECVVILDTPTPIPCADFAYPVRLLRSVAGGYAIIHSATTVTCSIYGGSNSGRDCIRRDVRLPEPTRGDVLVICDSGAYVRSLISTFNERLPPAAHCLRS